MDLSKLTLAQLKSKCKEAGLSGYSKQTKAVLLQRLQENAQKSGQTPSAQGEHLPSLAHPTPSSTAQPLTGPSAKQLTLQRDLANQQGGQPSVAYNQPKLPNSEPKTNLSKRKADVEPLATIIPSIVDIPQSTSSPSSAATELSSKSGRDHIMYPLPSHRDKIRLVESTPFIAGPNAKPTNTKPVLVGPGSTQRTITERESTKAPPNQGAPSRSASGRFKPLVVNRSSLASPKPSQRSSLFPPVVTSPISREPLVLKPIALPPPLSQRKHAYSWSIILSGLSDAERTICLQVSKLVRYAVYLSASAILSRYYPGKRLELNSSKNLPAVTNYWPYLRRRQSELCRAVSDYESSFLARLFRHRSMICPRLWASPDDDRQLSVALRFLLTRTCFQLSSFVGTGSDWANDLIVDVQDVGNGDIWRVETISRSRSHRDIFYVLESTCEVIGSPPCKGVQDSSRRNDRVIMRVDWSDYVQLCSRNKERMSIVDQLRCSNMEEYDKGISRLWLNRIAKLGHLGAVTKAIAERYVMACVVANSVSGKWMSSLQMARDFAGIPASTYNPRKEVQNLSLFLPEHHLVESVHLDTPKGQPLHEALAYVQTISRGYYVLRENGMEVGCEEDGVCEKWIEILECDANGVKA